MPYITSDYYLTTYGGKPSSDISSLDTAIKRASDTIDMLTSFKLQQELNIETVHPFIKANVEKATAALVEFYVLSGGYDNTVQTNKPDASLGSFSYSMKTSSGKSKESIEVPNNVINFLTPTGLLYMGIKTTNGGIYYDN